jgi:hypothetical protein
MSKNRIPFKSSNNKNSPYNMNEIDINLLMSNPKHIHKMMGRETEEIDENEDNPLPLIDVPKHLKNAAKSGSDNLKFFKETGSGLLKKYMDKDKMEPKKRHRTIAERIDKTQSNMYKNVDKTVDAVKNFKNDIKKKGLGRTVGNRKDRAMDLIIDWMSNDKAFKELNEKLRPASDVMTKLNGGTVDKEREKERKYLEYNNQESKKRKERIDNFNKE